MNPTGFRSNAQKSVKSVKSLRLLLLSAIAGGQALLPCLATADCSAKASATWSYCRAAADCIAAGSSKPCVKRDFSTILSSICFCSDPSVPPCVATASSSGNVAGIWALTCTGTAIGGGDWGYLRPLSVSDSADISVVGDRPTSTTFHISGSSSAENADFREIAVFRYTGDPNDFNGADVTSVQDLINQGFITSNDVLFQKTNDEIPSGIDFTFNVSASIPDSEIVVSATAHGETTPPNKCAGAKIKACGKKAACLLSLLAKNASKGDPIPADKRQKCLAQFSGAFAKAESKGGCLTTGDAGDLEDKVDIAADGTGSTLGSPLYQGTPNGCQGAKIKATGKKAKCLLSLKAKSASKGTAIDSAKVSKCTGKFSGAFAKAESKGGCKTTSDADDEETIVDNFVDDVDRELTGGSPSGAFLDR
jgi:hypothetical protein